MRGTPKTMMGDEMKTDHNVVGEVSQYLLEGRQPVPGRDWERTR